MGDPRPCGSAQPDRARAILARARVDLSGGRARGWGLFQLAQRPARAPALPGDGHAQFPGVARAARVAALRRDPRPLAARVGVMRRGACRGLLIALLGLGAKPAAAAAVLDAEAALEVGQTAIGRQLGDHAFRDTERRAVRLSDFRGKPLIINLVYTGCSSVCPLVVQSLHRAV